MQTGGTVPLILYFSTKWRHVVSFTLQPIYPSGKSNRYPLNRRQGGPRTGLNSLGKTKYLHVLGIKLCYSDVRPVA
jgi:hypothetical protein